MSKTRTIEIDSATADELEARAAVRGVAVREVVADLLASDDVVASVSAKDIAEIERQWADIEAGAPTVPHQKVARWLETWGTSGFRRWRDQ